MSQPLALLGIQVTAPGTKASLLSLIQVINANAGAFMAAASQVTLQGDPGNSTNNVLIGDDTIAANNYGLALTSSMAPVVLRSHRGADIPFGDMFVLASGGSPKLNVLIIP